jgi:hypothetical protein
MSGSPSRIAGALSGRYRLDDLVQRKKVRESSLADSANTIYAMIQLARTMKDLDQPLGSLDGLAVPVAVNDQKVSFLSRTNPAWVDLGVLVPGERSTPMGRARWRCVTQGRHATRSWTRC